MKRSGFTMIELIFVIVILGILAAVAIPRLAATRDDAKISTLATNVKQIVTDASAAYTAAGDLNVSTQAQWEAITNVRDNVTYSANQVVIDNGQSPKKDCVQIDYDETAGTISSKALDVTDAICQGVNARLGFQAVDDNNSISIKGSKVTY